MAGKKKASKKRLGKGKKLSKKQTLSRSAVIIE
jgi:hypothetical protein